MFCTFCAALRCPHNSCSTLLQEVLRFCWITMVLAHKLAPSAQAHAKISCPCPRSAGPHMRWKPQISITLAGLLAGPNILAGTVVVEVDP